MIIYVSCLAISFVNKKVTKIIHFIENKRKKIKVVTYSNSFKRFLDKADFSNVLLTKFTRTTLVYIFLKAFTVTDPEILKKKGGGGGRGCSVSAAMVGGRRKF